MLQGGRVVVGSEDDDTRALVEEAGLEPIINDAPNLGLSRSLQLGLAALESRRAGEPHVGAALVFLADQPLVRVEVVKAVISAWRAGTGAIVRPRYEARPDVPGHPVLLDRSIWPLVHRLEGDHGFAGLADSTSIPAITLTVAGDNPDVDTQADLHAIEESSR
jgi:molybdenum cofactor cytidylyltransferase